MPAPRISVIVPARDAATTIGATLDALAAQSGAGPFEVVVVDNGSTDDTAALARAHPLAPVVLCQQRGQGPGAARNTGVRAARAALLAFTDSDCRPTPGWLAVGVAALADAQIVQGRVGPPPGAEIGPFDRTVNVAFEGLYETANLFVTRAAFEASGGFGVDDATGVARGAITDAGRPFGEDTDFGWRARRAGARTAWAPDALVHHAVERRGAGAYVRDRARVAGFPGLVACVPELRSLLFARIFLTQRSAAFDLALASAIAAVAAGSWIPLAGLLPYAYLDARDALRWGKRRALAVSVAGIAADVVGLVALVRGSLRARRIVL